MSARVLAREWGVVVTCDADDGCEERYRSGCIRIRPVRAEMERHGWQRGGARGRKRQDFCPAHAAIATTPRPKLLDEHGEPIERRARKAGAK